LSQIVRTKINEPALDHFVGRDEVADEKKDGHDNVLSDGDDVGAGDLHDYEDLVSACISMTSDTELTLNALVNSGVEVDVVRADTGGDTHLQVLRFCDQVASQVARVEGCCDENLSLYNVGSVW
jgi:hypothetical protein